MELERFSPNAIAELQKEYPALDVRALALAVTGEVRSPDAVLRAKCKEAAALPDKEPARGKGPEHGGHWWPDGSWHATGDESDYYNAPSGSITRFVRKLVYERRNSAIGPAQVADLIVLHEKTDAFPCLEQWRSCSQWPQCWARTSAEQAVKAAGQGSHYRPDMQYSRP